MGRDNTTERRRRLADAVASRGFLRVVDASGLLAVSEVTIRGDFTALEASGLVVRVHGGAIPKSAVVAEPSLEQALGQSTEWKREIGRVAASLVSSGQSVLLDVGSTALAVADALVARDDLDDVSVITNGLSIALALEPAIPRFRVVLAGGTLRPLQHSLVNPGVSSFLESVHADLAFIGCNGIDIEHGVTNINYPEAEVKRRMMLSSRRRVLVADRGKVGQTHLGVVGSIAEFDALVTNGPMDDGLAALAASGLELILSRGIRH
jgi:DeoR family transcriptional regulator of aga operon